MSGRSEFVIVGSLAILGAVADPPDAMVMSIDVDTRQLVQAVLAEAAQEQAA